MKNSPIEEIKRIRHELGAEAGFDVGRIFAELREQYRSSSREYVVCSSNHPDRESNHPSGSGDAIPDGPSIPFAG